MLRQGRHRLGLDVADDAHFQGNFALRQLPHQPLVLDGGHPVADAHGPQLQGLPHALRPRRLPGVDRPLESQALRPGEQLPKPPCVIDFLGPRQVHPADHAALLKGRRQLQGLLVEALRLPVIPPHTAENQPQAQARVGVHAPPDAPDHRLRHLLLAEPLPGGILGGKTDLRQVHALRRHVLPQLEGHPLQGLLRLQAGHGHGEAGEIFSQAAAGNRGLHLRPQLLHRPRRQGDALLPRQLPHRLRPQGSIQMYMKFRHTVLPFSAIFRNSLSSFSLSSPVLTQIR